MEKAKCREKLKSEHQKDLGFRVQGLMCVWGEVTWLAGQLPVRFFSCEALYPSLYSPLYPPLYPLYIPSICPLYPVYIPSISSAVRFFSCETLQL